MFPPPRLPASGGTRWPGFVVEAVDQIPHLVGGHEDAAPAKRRESHRPRRRRDRDLLEEAIDGPPHELADGPILVPSDRPQPVHYRVGKQNLNLLHGYMLKTFGHSCQPPNLGNLPKEAAYLLQIWWLARMAPRSEVNIHMVAEYAPDSRRTIPPAVLRAADSPAVKKPEKTTGHPIRDDYNGNSFQIAYFWWLARIASGTNSLNGLRASVAPQRSLPPPSPGRPSSTAQAPQSRSY